MDVSQLRARQIEQGGERLRHGHDREHLAALALDPCADVQNIVLEVGEGVQVVDYLRRDDRLHAGVEIARAVVALLAGELGGVHSPHPLGAQPLAEQGADVLALAVERADGLVYGLELFFGRHAGADVVGIGLDVLEVEEAADADHEELVEVAGKDGGELEPLEQRDRLVHRLGEHPVVEGEPGELAVLRVRMISHGAGPPFQACFQGSPRARRSCW